MTGFKEVWHNSRAAQAMKTERLYEAGGSITWTSLPAFKEGQ